MVAPEVSYCGCRLTSVVLMSLRSTPAPASGVDDRLLTVVGLVHRRGDVRRDEFHADVGGERVGNALYVTGADDRDLTRVFAHLVRRVVAGGRRRGESQGEQ